MLQDEKDRIESEHKYFDGYSGLNWRSIGRIFWSWGRKEIPSRWKCTKHMFRSRRLLGKWPTWREVVKLRRPKSQVHWLTIRKWTQRIRIWGSRIKIWAWRYFLAEIDQELQRGAECSWWGMREDIKNFRE